MEYNMNDLSWSNTLRNDKQQSQPKEQSGLVALRTPEMLVLQTRKTINFMFLIAQGPNDHYHLEGAGYVQVKCIEVSPDARCICAWDSSTCGTMRAWKLG